MHSQFIASFFARIGEMSPASNDLIKILYRNSLDGRRHHTDDPSISQFFHTDSLALIVQKSLVYRESSS